MNHPHVIALIYRVEHGSSVDYERAGPLRFDDDPRFYLTVEGNCARFEMKEHYADVGEARYAIESFIQMWEFDAGVRLGPNAFSLRYTNAEIIDRNPSPPKTGTGRLQVGGGHVASNVRFGGKVRIGLPHYPSPPERGTLDPDDDYVVKMKRRYDKYRLGRTTLPDVAYFCVTVLEDKYGDLPAAAKACGISKSVLKEVKALSSYKGGEDSRKSDGFDVEFTREEKRFLKRALKEIIIRAAQVAADDSQRQPQITMAELPGL